MASARTRAKAIELRKMRLPPSKIAAVLGVSRIMIFHWTKHLDPSLKMKPGGPRSFDHDEAIRLLQHPFWTPSRVALLLGVSKQAIHQMVKRRLPAAAAIRATGNEREE